MYERHVEISGVTAVSGKLLAGINSNYGDTAKFTSSTASDVKEICEEFEGNDNGDEPTSISTGPSDVSLDYPFFIRSLLKILSGLHLQGGRGRQGGVNVH